MKALLAAQMNVLKKVRCVMLLNQAAVPLIERKGKNRSFHENLSSISLVNVDGYFI